MNYSFFYKKKIEDISHINISRELEYDLFVSSYNETDRVNHVFNNISAKEKHWLIFPEYNFAEIELKSLKGSVFNYSKSQENDEAEIIVDYFSKNEEKIRNSRIAIDITGMLRPYIIFLVRFFKEIGLKKVDFIYSEPLTYEKKEETEFSKDYLDVREVKGFSGSHNPETFNDVLIFGSGYDYHKIKMIAKEKKQTRKVQVLGFPSLQADMFQQSILKSYEAEEDASSGEFDLDSNNVILAPANDPFITAQLISDYVKKSESNKKFTNLYISPISTKAQTLGMALFYTFECIDKPASIIFPFSKKYSRKTCDGVSKVWVYTVEYP
ncbi:hypothetical protein KUL156_43110 [Alteromonas sp. KUL156]|nr:hypothetical protein KUL154_18540 [Alteromonas sp. KUL154]GFE01719.1 hypothetical protein KUL156_43110 [Alteromonas sp. KUL156]